MKTNITTVTATQTTFIDDAGRSIGRTWELNTTSGIVFVTEAHDWYDDPAQAAREITERADRHARGKSGS